MNLFSPHTRLRFYLFVLAVFAYGSGFLSLTTPGHAQADACPVLVDQAMEAVGQNCTDLERSSACYGFESATAQFTSSLTFASPADRAELTELESLQTVPFDPANTHYGVTVLNVQANIPAAHPGEAVTMVLLGDVTIENAVAPDEAVLPVEPVRVVVTSSQRVNLRSTASRTGTVVGTAEPREILMADGTNEAGDWLRVVREDGTAWIASNLVASSPEDADELAALPIVGAGTLTPMQRFYFSTGLSLSGCAEAPDLLVIQTPQDTPARLTINGAEVEIGSSVALIGEDTFFGDLLAFGVMEDQLTDAPVADDTRCLYTRMVVLDGRVLLGDEISVSTGHLSQFVACLDETGEPDFVSEWTAPARLSRDELAFFGVVERIPEAVLHYPIRLPGEADIDLALVEPTNRPAATTQPRPTAAGGATTEPRPTVPPGATQPAATPAPTQPTGNQPDCSTFRATSPAPGGVISSGPYAFYWDAARNVQAYQLVIIPLVDGQPSGQNLFRTGANNTTISVDVAGSFPLASAVRWYVQALVGSEPNFTAVCDSAVSDNPIQR